MKQHIQAFPGPGGRAKDGSPIASHYGMTLRAYMATKFMAALIANPNPGHPDLKWCITQADALIAELEK